MKKTKKRGFTIVELVIVIAVIAILAAVLVPTFTNVISAAKESVIMQEARGAWMDHIAELDAEDLPKDVAYIQYKPAADSKNNQCVYFKLNGISFEATALKYTDITASAEIVYTFEKGASSLSFIKSQAFSAIGKADAAAPVTTP